QLEAEDCGVCRRAWRARALSDFVPRFLGVDISGHQRLVANRAFDSTSETYGAVCEHGYTWLRAGMRAAFFHRAKGRRSGFSTQGGRTRRNDTSLARTERIWRHAGGGAAAASHSIQIFCVGCGRVSGAASKLLDVDCVGASISLLRRG